MKIPSRKELKKGAKGYESDSDLAMKIIGVMARNDLKERAGNVLKEMINYFGETGGKRVYRSCIDIAIKKCGHDTYEKLERVITYAHGLFLEHKNNQKYK